MRQSLSLVSKITIMMLVVSLVLGSGSFGGVLAVNAEEVMPDLTITEAVLNSSGSGQLFEYVEIYNNTTERIDLDGYQLQYFTTNFSNPANKWKISNKSIEAKGTLVLWLKKFANPNSLLAEFNANYNVNLITEQVFEVALTTEAQGLADGARRKVGIANASGTLLSAAIINDNTENSGFNDGANENKDKSVTYRYAGNIDMEKISNGQLATPGTLTPDQMLGPKTPTNLSVIAGDQTVQLTWESDDATVAQYSIQYYAATDPDRVITRTQTSDKAYQFDQLVNNTSYIFWVRAVDAAGLSSSATNFMKSMPIADGADGIPAVPTGLEVTPGINRITLSWAANVESNIAGYKVYSDGVLYETLTAANTQANIGGLINGKEYSLAVSAFNVLELESAHSSAILAKPVDKLPELLITELAPDTDNFAALDAFEFFEVYNASDASIDLQGYKIKSGWNHIITDSVVLAAGETLVFWTRRAEIAELTREGFNSYYYSSYASKYLSEEQIYIIDDVGGLVNGGSTVVIEDAEGFEISRAVYASVDVAVGKSTVFSYPKDGSVVMEKIAGKQEATPGSLVSGQAPAKTKVHQLRPQAPANVQATASDGTVTVNWLANSEPDIFKYNIYMNGSLEHSVPASQLSFVAHQLTGNKSYGFEVTAVDQSDNESLKSQVQIVTPGHQLITQVERAINAKDDKYAALWAVSEEGPIIPGLAQDLVPQGVVYYKEKDWILSVYYMNDGRPGVISVIDATTDELIKSVVLYHEDGSPYIGHAGGIVVSEKHVWISSENFMHQLDLQELVSAPNNAEIKFKGSMPVDLQAGFATYADGVLWVGEFYEPKAYPTDVSHHLTGRDGKKYYAWIEGFVLDGETDMVSSEK
ncbi:MAG TPA: lamin tail domain-containing protein, partial [Candidatus Paenibacillus intestinavium]|nr:lamin tail domain-containing protein [Candidatus Paenibacillus intestinavium]